MMDEGENGWNWGLIGALLICIAIWTLVGVGIWLYFS